jgi:hypothetical protein
MSQAELKPLEFAVFQCESHYDWCGLHQKIEHFPTLRLYSGTSYVKIDLQGADSVGLPAKLAAAIKNKVQIIGSKAEMKVGVGQLEGLARDIRGEYQAAIVQICDGNKGHLELLQREAHLHPNSLFYCLPEALVRTPINKREDWLEHSGSSGDVTVLKNLDGTVQVVHQSTHLEPEDLHRLVYAASLPIAQEINTTLFGRSLSDGIPSMVLFCRDSHSAEVEQFRQFAMNHLVYFSHADRENDVYHCLPFLSGDSLVETTDGNNCRGFACSSYLSIRLQPQQDQQMEDTRCFQPENHKHSLPKVHSKGSEIQLFAIRERGRV